MRKCFALSFFLPALLIALAILASPNVTAQDTLVINYQGLITDRETGEPLTGSVQLTFRLYKFDAEQWSSPWAEVDVDNGLFNVMLGSRTPLPVSLFDGDDIYLGIQVGTEPELSPRTLFTTVPYAAFAHNFAGGLELSDGMMVLSGPTIDSGIVMAVEDAASIKLGIPPGIHSNIELVADPTAGASIAIIDDGKEVMGVEPSPFYDGYSLSLFDPTWEPSSPLLTLRTEYDEVGVESSVDMLMFNPQPEPPGFEFLKLGIASGGIASMRLGPPSDGIQPTVELVADPTAGASIAIIDDGKEFIAGGASLAIIDDGKELIGGPGSIGIIDDGKERMGIEPSPFYPGLDMKLYDPALVDPSELISLNTAYDATGPGSSASIKMFQPQPEPPGQEAITMSTMTGLGGSIKMFQPQPEPPGREILSISATPAGVANILLGEATGISLTADGTESTVGIGTATPSEALYVVGNIYATGSISEYSDASAKTNVRPLNGALAMVDDLQGVRYDWVEEEAREVNGGDREQIGFIAQDVEEVLPEVVLTVDEDKKAINYSRLTAVLVEAIKELKAENEELKSRIEALESK